MSGDTETQVKDKYTKEDKTGTILKRAVSACLVLVCFNHVCMRLASLKANAVLGSFGYFFPFQNLYLYDCIVSASVSNYFTELFPEKTKLQLWFVSQIIETTTKRGEFLVSFLARRPSKLQKNGLLWFGVCSLGLWWRHSCWKMAGSKEVPRKRGGRKILTESRQVA